jgi:hypothetical protein
MPDERLIASYFDRAVDVVTEQTRQIARLAFAVEQQVLMQLPSGDDFAAPCDACGCRLLTMQHTKCPACLTPTRNDA